MSALNRFKNNLRDFAVYAVDRLQTYTSQMDSSGSVSYEKDYLDGLTLEDLAELVLTQDEVEIVGFDRDRIFRDWMDVMGEGLMDDSYEILKSGFVGFRDRSDLDLYYDCRSNGIEIHTK